MGQKRCLGLYRARGDYVIGSSRVARLFARSDFGDGKLFIKKKAAATGFLFSLFLFMGKRLYQ